MKIEKLNTLMYINFIYNIINDEDFMISQNEKKINNFDCFTIN